MPRKPRIHYTKTDKSLMWDRWQKGVNYKQYYTGRANIRIDNDERR